MAQSTWFDQHLLGCPIMAILRNFSVEESLELSHRAWDLGIEHVEVPIQNQQGLDALAAVVEAGNSRGKYVGAGTVDSSEKVFQAQEIGAAYTVAPGLDDDVVEASSRADLPHLPGVATASEIQRALGHGLTWMKAFPAHTLGPAWFTAMRGPFPQVNFVATGGLDTTNVEAYLNAGAKVTAVGSALQQEDQISRLSQLITAPSDGA
ncbi:bifunctional 4-hydroxy-2-oxoglutarate aldolase/2-dehydro-3-deoxy-phosphogluconate aldolase [Citricoccus muralis]|uniref:Bifunctional 4-hydroxy-2-oxoglutarate aldolase/2-dehydro-3-deoxy-phosphogluconate aldolase n=1 Tax=Citricoccus muralis TaxID=169134 RepID=A0ABY8H8M4_9MICC|nr:bifunctional 4-hydroxy-2-oxoglutarate aldolase/2-dehydro-3-deoxy-phosphogluconate aldolase [Citricoccus muralis]WFP17008.1 bifunctional 4-hydroxy-2-oxoglutarate aldolase/2-dehydro-3-deoxy-phosphogluconate aldolase [Citricoccus muralis]